jgi:hypothetical protein
LGEQNDDQENKNRNCFVKHPDKPVANRFSDMFQVDCSHARNALVTSKYREHMGDTTMRTSLTRLLTTALLFGVLICVPMMLFAQGNGGGGLPPIEKNMPPVVVPDFCWVTGGIHVTGDEASLARSDDEDFAVRRSPLDVQAPHIEFVVMGTSPTPDPTSFAVTLEGAVFARSPVIQTIELYDFDAAAWVLVDTREATKFVDSTVTVTMQPGITAPDFSRFVGRKSNYVEARIRYQSLNPRQNFVSFTDHFVWMIGQ